MRDFSVFVVLSIYVILFVLLQLQDYGQPPTELVGDPTANMPAFDPSALNDPSQCCLM